ncbi:MAG: hypothetical protein ACI8RP_000213 [Urechidicola sp.]|jgi:hypothetical protein
MDQKAGKNSEQYQAQRDINIVKAVKSKTKLSVLFDKLNSEFNDDDQISHIIKDLESYTIDTDVIGLEEKIKNGGREKYTTKLSWLKQEYRKKLERFKNYPSAQKIHTLILADVLFKFSIHIEPLLEKGPTEEEIRKAVSIHIVEPVYKVIDEEGCDDIMGLNKTDIHGMVYYLTGKCHIKWN